MAEALEKSEVAKKEEETLAFWKDRKIFEKTLTKKSPKGEFVFYEGPPTANGRPGIHHMETRAFKDALTRYKTMRGYHVLRRAGWDTHGLPVELEVEKQLGFTGKKDIESYGIAAFNKKCRESVYAYIDEWGKFTERIGYWVDQTKAYFTLDASYMEVLWHVFSQIAKDGRVYKDYKVVPWCPRDGTALSSHELAQGYTDVKDLTVTARFELVDEPGTYVLAWTTTPWTLPGNVGLAIGSGIAYGVYEKEGEKVIVADARAKDVLGEGWNRVGDRATSTLVGKKYKPLYDYAHALASETEKPKFERAFQIYPADFVTTEDGTGVVHTAVMYGQEDFELGTKVGLPKVHLVNLEGKFVAGTGFLEGKSVVDEQTTIEIIQDLARRTPKPLLFDKAKYEHTYPFCWRCKTRIIYYARDSWYIRMTDLRDELVKENKKIHWEPEHIRDGRMGEWLSNVKDWAISRERYWGTPLPIWETEDGKERVFLGSVEELKKRTKKHNNTYFVMRHGESENNVKDMLDSTNEQKWKLTKLGEEECVISAKQLSHRRISKIFASPFERTKQTAEIVAKELGIPKEQIVFDARLGDEHMGDFEGKPRGELIAFRKVWPYDKRLPGGGESSLEVRRRFGEFLYEIDAAHANEHILIVTHGIGVEVLPTIVDGLPQEESKRAMGWHLPANAEVEELKFVPLPHNENYELDLHRPFIDDAVLLSDSGKEMRRVKEVMDVWFDSGAMPFAQGARDRGNASLETYIKKVPYPADYISEAIDQTRGWFYTLHAVGTLMKRGGAYKNVICLGHLLDAQGQKMSKSKGNVLNPWDEINKWGVDTARFWMYYVNQPGDSKNYDEKTVREAAKVLSWIENSASFYKLFKDQKLTPAKETVLDRWLRARLIETVEVVTEAMDGYRPYEAAREIGHFAEDLSQWYVRRARERVREGDAAAHTVLKESLRTIAVVLAPMAPFLAERLFETVKEEGDPESVHLASWPEEALHQKATRALRARGSAKLIDDMARVRVLASDILQLRQKAGIKVRQPLLKVCVPDALSDDLGALLAEEVNVKHVRTSAATVEIDTELTPELIREGDVREFTRALSDARKNLNLAPQDKVELQVSKEGQATLADAEILGVAKIAFDAAPDAPYSAELSTGAVRFSVTTHAP